MKINEKLKIKNIEDRLKLCEMILNYPEDIQFLVKIIDADQLRTTKQNRYYYYTLTEIEKYTGHDADYLHNFFSEKFLPKNIKSFLILENEEPKNLTINEFNEYIEKVIKFSIEEFGFIHKDYKQK